MRQLNRLLLSLTCASLCACQPYTALTLNQDEHTAAWRNRRVDESVERFAQRVTSLVEEGAYDPGDGINATEAAAIALVFNSNLRVARLKAGIKSLGAAEAGRWDDPQFNLDMLRVTKSVQHPWIAGAGINFSVPLSGRLETEKKLASAEAAAELHRVLDAEWSVVLKVRQAWVQWAAAIQRITLTEQYLKQIDAILTLAARQRQANKIGVTDERILRIERATQSGQLKTLQSLAQRHELQLKMLMGLTPNAEINLTPSLKPAAIKAADIHPRLAVAQADFDSADHAFRHEIQKQYPDLKIGPLAEEENASTRVGVGIGVPLPLFNQNRRAIAETRAARDTAKAVYEAEYESLVAQFAQAQLDVDAAHSRREYLEKTVAPLVDQQTSDLQRLGKLGDFDVLVVLDALTRTHETKLEIVSALIDEAIARDTLMSLDQFRKEDPEEDQK